MRFYDQHLAMIYAYCYCYLNMCAQTATTTTFAKQYPIIKINTTNTDCFLKKSKAYKAFSMTYWHTEKLYL